MAVHLTVKTVQRPGGTEASQFPIDVERSATVAELKEQLAQKIGLQKEHIRLVCAGRIWADAQTVASYEPADGDTVHLVHNPPKGAAPTAAEQVPQVANPMQSLFGAPAPTALATTGGGDPMQSMMAQSQQMLMQNPEVVQQIMRSPMVQQMMSDPEMVRAMMRMNPQLNQLMEQRPEIARMLEDPDVLRQSMQMMANPSLMREMTRNADRAIGQLDAMPGGHSALLRAHQEFADPLYQALSGANSAQITENAEAYAQQTQGAPNAEALPNPWGASGAPSPAPAPAPAPAAAQPGAAGGAAAVPPLPGFQAPLGGAGAGAGAANPMAAMMQQMMLGAQPGGLGGGGAAVAPATAGGLPAMNPMAAMMQQMMGDPAQMQQMMAISQQLMGGGLGGAAPGSMMGMPGLAPNSTPAPQELGPEAIALQRVRFASQLSQLMDMGFTNEAVCLRALARHNGRLDAAIESLLSGTGSD